MAGPKIDPKHIMILMISTPKKESLLLRDSHFEFRVLKSKTLKMSGLLLRNLN